MRIFRLIPALAAEALGIEDASVRVAVHRLRVGAHEEA